MFTHSFLVWLLNVTCEHHSSSQYPKWLEDNKSSLSPEDYQRYEKQAQIMTEICGHFEREKHESEKESTFENIMDLMQKVDRLCSQLYSCWVNHL